MGQSQSKSDERQSQTHITDLPNELVSGIFQFLGPKDMKSAVLVCKSWSEIGEKPSFWTWALVTVNNKDDLYKLKIPRLQMLQEIKVTHRGHGVEVWYKGMWWGWWGNRELSKHKLPVECKWIKEGGLAELFQVISEIPTVRRIHGLEYCVGIKDMEPGLVVSVLNRLEDLKLCCGGEMIRTSDQKTWIERDMILSYEQLELLFIAMAENTKLKYLEVSGQPHMAKISPELFAAAVGSVQNVVLEEVRQEDITTKQLEALYATIAFEERPVRKLTIHMDPRLETDPELLSLAFNRLEEVTNFGGGSGEQLTAILRNLVEEDSRIQKLMFEEVELEIVQNLDMDLVRRVEEKIGKFYTIDRFGPNALFAVV